MFTNHEVKNHVYSIKLGHRKPSIKGYGTSDCKEIGDIVRICAPGHKLEKSVGTVIALRPNECLVCVQKWATQFNVWLKISDLRRV